MKKLRIYVERSSVMDRKTEEFHTVDFFRKIRDEQAAVLAGKSPAEIIAFFSKPKPESTERSGAKRQPAV
jgi:oligoribonuclease (3'-5' exoribonuclease)